MSVCVCKGVFTLIDTETDTETDKNGLYRIVWRSLYCTKTPKPLGTVAILSGLSWYKSLLV